MNIFKKVLSFAFLLPLVLSMSLFCMHRGGTVVVVAGPSSCGKTMLTAKLVEALNEADLYGGNWVRFSLDDVTKEFDERSSSDGSDAAESDSDDEKFEPISDLSDGNKALYQKIKTAVKCGSNVVVDTVFDEDEDKLDAFKVELFKDDIVKPKRCLTVFLYCSVETLLERVAVRNAKQEDDDTRNAGMVLRVFAKMMTLPKKAGAAAAADDGGLRMSPKEFDYVVRTSPIMKKIDFDLERLIGELKYNLGLHGDEQLPALLVPKANYDCLVRSDTLSNDQWRENVEAAIDQIMGRLQRLMVRK